MALSAIIKGECIPRRRGLADEHVPGSGTLWTSPAHAGWTANFPAQGHEAGISPAHAGIGRNDASPSTEQIEVGIDSKLGHQATGPVGNITVIGIVDILPPRFAWPTIGIRTVGTDRTVAFRNVRVRWHEIVRSTLAEYLAEGPIAEVTHVVATQTSSNFTRWVGTWFWNRAYVHLSGLLRQGNDIQRCKKRHEHDDE